MKKLIFTLTCILLAIPCQARIIYVDWDGSGDYLTIQAAINDANDGDTIIVADGTYTGDGNRDIDFLGKAITLRSTDPNDPNVVTGTIIDCQGSLEHPHRGFYLHNSEDANSVLAGFTITNGVGHPIWRSGVLFSEGGAIFCDASSPTISQCNITGNVAQLIDGGTNYWYGGCGGGIRCYGNSNPTIRNCTITNNFAGGGHQNYGNGGGISCSNSSPTIICCTIADNSTPWSYSYHGGGGIFLSNSSIVSNCIISGNSSSHGGGIYSQGNNVIVTNCTFNCNSSHWGGGGIYLTANSTVTNCIFWDDMPNEILVTGGWSPAITYSDIQGGWLGVGNIDVYPCFADPCSGDYHLQSEASRWDPNSQSWVLDNGTSPCIDAGNPGCPLGDEPAPNGNRRNMGAYGGTVEASKPPTYWRSIADMTNDWIVDSNDLKVFVGYWLETGECIPSDLNRSQSVDFNDFAIFGLQWSYPSVFEPGMTFQIDDCNMEAGLNWTAAAESNEPRFSVWVEGRYIHFEDSMYANCCPFELWLEKEINGNQ
ncbi:MAG: right-handed parallel beta-helix repeat-containing protein, partial [Sedimentisphaerales bacterium]